MRNRTLGYNPPYNHAGGRAFIAYLYLVGWDCINLGVSVCLSLPNVEVHLPFCFLRIGWRNDPPASAIQHWVAED